MQFFVNGMPMNSMPQRVLEDAQFEVIENGHESDIFNLYEKPADTVYSKLDLETIDGDLIQYKLSYLIKTGAVVEYKPIYNKSTNTWDLLK